MYMQPVDQYLIYKLCTFLSSGGTDYVIATTKIINGSSLLDKLASHTEPVKLNPFMWFNLYSVPVIFMYEQNNCKLCYGKLLRSAFHLCPQYFWDKLKQWKKNVVRRQCQESACWIIVMGTMFSLLVIRAIWWFLLLRKYPKTTELTCLQLPLLLLYHNVQYCFLFINKCMYKYLRE